MLHLEGEMSFFSHFPRQIKADFVTQLNLCTSEILNFEWRMLNRVSRVLCLCYMAGPGLCIMVVGSPRGRGMMEPCRAGGNQAESSGGLAMCA